MDSETEAEKQFRKNYFLQRLAFINTTIEKKDAKIFDCGCGYGTTALFFAINSTPILRTTLEFYFDQVKNRKDYWNEFGNADLFDCTHQNIIETPPAEESLDYIILQDTLHHLEPVEEALAILFKA